VDDEAGLDVARQHAGGTAGFEVLGDGVRLGATGTLTTHDPARALDLDVTGHVPWWPAERSEVTLHQILLYAWILLAVSFALLLTGTVGAVYAGAAAVLGASP